MARSGRYAWNSHCRLEADQPPLQGWFALVLRSFIGLASERNCGIAREVGVSTIGKLLGLLAAAAGLFAASGSVRASGDDSCYPSWRLASASFDCAGRIVMTPGNDSRLNLFLLLRSRGAVADAGLSYPSHDFEDREFAHNFLTWDSVSSIYFPQPKPDSASDYVANGSRCDSASAGAKAFDDALTADRTMPAAERTALTKARADLSPNCTEPRTAPTSAWPNGISSGAGASFLAYLKAADAFYRGDWATARGAFAALVHARQRWVAETSAYMLVRVELGAAIAGAFDKFGDFGGIAKADHTAAVQARAAIAAYLHGWPQGLYAESAKGLERRALWLAGDQTRLGRAYEALLTDAPASSGEIVGLIDEVDNKLLTEAGADQMVDTPMLLAVLDLMRMRSTVAEDGTRSAPLLTAAQFAAQRAHFSARPDLFAFLQAAHAFYLDRDAKAALVFAPAAGPQANWRPLDFSSAVLHGMALTELHDSGEADYWRGLLRGAKDLYQRPLVELALARNFERSGHLADAFAPESPLAEAQLRAILLQHDAGPDLLRALAHGGGRTRQERDLAAFALLWKELTRGRYAEFLGDYALVPAAAPASAVTPNPGQTTYDTEASGSVPLSSFAADIVSDGYACPKLQQTLTVLARSPADARAMLCLGEFHRTIMATFPALDGPAPVDELGSGPSDFPGRPTARGQFYDRVIADPTAPPAEKAYALYRAVNCYAPSGNNDCGGNDAPKAQRRAWFDRLKHDYADSRWAKSLRYFW